MICIHDNDIEIPICNTEKKQKHIQQICIAVNICQIIKKFQIFVFIYCSGLKKMVQLYM